MATADDAALETKLKQLLTSMSDFGIRKIRSCISDMGYTAENVESLNLKSFELCLKMGKVKEELENRIAPETEIDEKRVELTKMQSNLDVMKFQANRDERKEWMKLYESLIKTYNGSIEDSRGRRKVTHGNADRLYNIAGKTAKAVCTVTVINSCLPEKYAISSRVLPVAVAGSSEPTNKMLEAVSVVIVVLSAAGFGLFVVEGFKYFTSGREEKEARQVWDREIKGIGEYLLPRPSNGSII